MTTEKIKSSINIVSVLTVIAGLFGMVFCYRFLWSAQLEDLVGAGFPFIGGAVLFGCGLIALSLNNRRI